MGWMHRIASVGRATAPDLSRSVGLIALHAVLVLIASGGCDRKQQSPPAGAGGPAGSGGVTVSVRPIQRRDLQRTVEVVGTLYGDEDTTISAKVAGRVLDVALDVGDRAERGKPLAQIDPTDYELTLRQKELAVREVLARLGLEQLPSQEFDPSRVPSAEKARLEAANAEARFNRGRQLHEQQPPLISDQDFSDLRTAFDVARSSYDVELLTARSQLNQAGALSAQAGLARQALADTTVRVPGGGATAPTSGPSNDSGHSYVVAARMVSVGEYVREGTPLFRLIDDDPQKLRCAVPERYTADVRVGQRVRLWVEAYGDRAFEGRLTRINPQVDPATRTFSVEAVVPNEERLLKSGSFARAIIETRTDQGVTLVPRDAIVQFAGANKVFTVSAEGKAIEHAVQVGDSSADGLIEIVSGLPPDAGPVLVENAARLAGGVPVKVRSASPATRGAATAPATARAGE
jgi:RND family efflux transporter MFP subunit